MAWAPDYVTAEQLKSYVNINHGDTSAFDLWLANWATAVSRNVDDFCGRQFGQTALVEERFYSPRWDRNECQTYLEIDDLHTTTGFVVEDNDGTAVTDYTLWPRNALVKGKPYERISFDTAYTEDLSLTGKWGWNAVPTSIPTAAYIQASRLSARKSSPLGIAGSPQDGSELRLLAKLDPDFITALRPFVRKWYAR